MGSETLSTELSDPIETSGDVSIMDKGTELMHAPDRKTVTATSRCRESNCVLCCSESCTTAETNLNGSETMCSLILKLSHSNIIHQVFLVLIAVPVCLRAGVTVFRSGVCKCS